MRQAFRHIVARFRPIPLFVLAAVLSLCLVPAAWPETTAARRASARSQFERADRQRIALLAKPQKERTADEYLQLIASYRRVYLITPRAPEQAPAAATPVVQVAPIRTAAIWSAPAILIAATTTGITSAPRSGITTAAAPWRFA